jgi:L-arabinose isomerase
MKSIKIIFSTNSGEKINISLIDITGRIIEKKSILPSGNMQILSVGENIQSGVYFIKIDLGKDSVLKKAMLIK